MRILILHNELMLNAQHPEADAEHEVVWVAEILETILREAGFEVSRMGLGAQPDALIERLRREKTDAVFNLFEHCAEHPADEEWVSELLEWMAVPFTGNTSHTVAVARKKHLAKGLMAAAGLPTPAYCVIDQLDSPLLDAGTGGPLAALRFPVIVKPSGQDASEGIDQGSVVQDVAAVRARAQKLLQQYREPVLVEEFIRGRELSVSVIENPGLQALPACEILFTDPDPAVWPILTYDAKWKPDTREYDQTPPRYPADVAPELAAQLGRLAQRAFQVLGCRDYARVDFRVDATGQPYIIELNPNPDISPNAMLSGSLGSAGLRHADFVVTLARRAIARGQERAAAAAAARPSTAGQG